jgi:hypothetical protein
MTPDHKQSASPANTGAPKQSEQDALRSALKLEQWYFIGAGDGAEPVIGIVDGKPHLMAFTDPESAFEMAQRRASRQNFAACPPPIISMPLADAIALCRRLMNVGIAGVVFNNGTKAPMPKVLDAYRHAHKHAGSPPPAAP